MTKTILISRNSCTIIVLPVVSCLRPPNCSQEGNAAIAGCSYGSPLRFRLRQTYFRNTVISHCGYAAAAAGGMIDPLYYYGQGYHAHATVPRWLQAGSLILRGLTHAAADEKIVLPDGKFGAASVDVHLRFVAGKCQILLVVAGTNVHAGRFGVGL